MKLFAICVSFYVKSILYTVMHTVWKFQNFSVTHILCEIKVGWFRVSKSAISTHLEAVNLDFNDFLQFLKAENDQKSKLKASKMAIIAVLLLLNNPKLISRRIWWVTEKFCKGFYVKWIAESFFFRETIFSTKTQNKGSNFCVKLL